MTENIKQDLWKARKNRDSLASSLLTTLLSDIQMVGKNAGRETTEGEAISIVKKYVENTKLFISKLDSADVGKLESLNAELAILNSYLPRQMTESEIEVNLRDIVAAGTYGPKDMGKLLKEFKTLFDGRYDGKTAADMAKRVLS